VINYVVGSRSPKTKVTPTGTEIPPLAFEAIVDLYSKDVDRSLIQENLRLGFVERLKRAQANAQAANRIRGKALTAANDNTGR
jgi:hypothetical protein